LFKENVKVELILHLRNPLN